MHQVIVMGPTNSVKNIEWWCQTGVKNWVMSDEWWVMSDGNWVIKNGWPNRLLVSVCQMLNAEILAFDTLNTKTYALSLAKSQIVLQHVVKVLFFTPNFIWVPPIYFQTPLISCWVFPNIFCSIIMLITNVLYLII